MEEEGGGRGGRGATEIAAIVVVEGEATRGTALHRQGKNTATKANKTAQKRTRY